MTKRQAREWVHTKLIIVEMAHEELVAAFTALAERPPAMADFPQGLFRVCCDIVTSTDPCWPVGPAVVLAKGGQGMARPR